MLKILIVDSDTEEKHASLRDRGDPTTGEGYANALKACRADIDCTVVAPYFGEEMPALDGFDGVVFTGSGVAWNTDDDRAEPLRAAMRRVFDRGLPTLGSCNGMQLAASVLGGRSDASPNGREDGIARGITLTPEGQAHPLMAGREDGFAVPSVHRDEVAQLPEGATLLACNAHSPVQAFAYERDGIKFWGVQYHPEYPADFIGRMVDDGRFPPEEAADLRRADTDAEAAKRLGIRPGEFAPEVRLTELRNWLASL